MRIFGGLGCAVDFGMIYLLVVLVVIGVVLYLINTLLPIDPKIRLLINVVVILGVCIWLLQFFGLLDGDSWHHRPFR